MHTSTPATKAGLSLERFLDTKYRQVWAVHRATGERVYLNRGDATDEMRAYTREMLKCPVPNCLVEISARGRSKRDHFFHLGESGHGEGEGEWHLQAKALLADWANRQPGFTAREEETVHLPDGRIRRADVMATHESGRKVALEVEYKAYTPEEWQKKQADYDSVDVVCTWVFGHLHRYLRQPRRPADFPVGRTWNRLRWVELTEEVALDGRPVLFINPVERGIATAVDEQRPLAAARLHHGWWQSVDGIGETLADPDRTDDPTLVLDDLAECELDPLLGIITPTMRRIASERLRIAKVADSAARAAAAKAAAAADSRAREAEMRAQAHRQSVLAAEAAWRRLPPTPDEAETAAAYTPAMRERDANIWLTHPLRARIVHHQGAVPGFLETELPRDRLVYAHPAHWHSALFTSLVLENRPGARFEFFQIIRMLKDADVSLPPDTRASLPALRDFLRHLRQEGFLSLNTGGLPNTILEVSVLRGL